MTVKEMIKLLQKMPEDSPVAIVDSSDYDNFYELIRARIVIAVRVENTEGMFTQYCDSDDPGAPNIEVRLVYFDTV
jgi:hypothetical protein